MTFWRVLGAVEIRAVAASVIAAAVLAAVATAQTLAAPPGIFTPYESARAVFLTAAMVGVPVAVLYGAPIYAVLLKRGLASASAALLLGIAPGAAVYLFEPKEQQFALWVMGGGIAAALLTHLSMRGSTGLPRSNSVVEQDARQKQPRASHHER